MWVIPVTWFVGIFVSIIVHRTRAGIPFYATLSIIGPHTGWLFVQAIKSIFWPVVLVAWFLRGRPGPNVVFGNKAERRLLEQQKAASGQLAAGNAETR